MAQTFVVVRDDLGADTRSLCLKMLHAHLAEQPEERAAFLDEVRLLQRLSHTQVVSCLDAHFAELAHGEAGDASGHDARPWFVMEFIEGLDLHQLVRRLRTREQRIPWRLAAYIAAEICSPLGYIHEYGDAQIVHRDLSPSNVLIGLDGHLKLADFGIAKFEGRAKHTKTGFTKGKQSYMSPEHVQPKRGMDARSDLFSLGVILYELLSDQKPFPDSLEFPAAAAAIVHGDFTPLDSVASDLPAELVALVGSLLNPNKEARPSSAREVRRELIRIAQLPDGRDQLEAMVREAVQAVSLPNAPTRDPVSAIESILEAVVPEPSDVRSAVNAVVPTASHDSPLEPATLPARAVIRERDEDLPPLLPSGEHAARKPTGRFGPRVAGGLLGVAIVVASVALALQPAPSDPRRPNAPPSVFGRPQVDAASAAAGAPAQTSAPAPSGELTTVQPLPPQPSADADSDPGLPERAARTGRSRMGALEVIVAPWGLLAVDGKQHGDATALRRVSLKAGSHRVEIFTDERGPARLSETIRIRAGETTRKEYRITTGE